MHSDGARSSEEPSPGSVLLVAPEGIFFFVDIHAVEELVEAGRLWAVEVTVRVDSAEQAQAQPTEVLFARGTGHLVAAVHFLYISSTAWAAFAVLTEPVSAKGLFHCFLDHPLPKALFHELFRLVCGCQVLVFEAT